MTITGVMAKIAMTGGFGFVCAHCDHLWEGMAANAHGCLFPDCGGPLLKLDYPRYQGLLPPETISMSCFVCGKTATGGFFREGLTRPVGYCTEHKMYLSEMEAKKP